MWATAAHVDHNGPAVEYLQGQRPFSSGPQLGVVGQFGNHG